MSYGCVEVRERAPDLALGALNGAERALVLAHLETCGACRELVDELASVAPIQPPLTAIAPTNTPLDSPGTVEQTAYGLLSDLVTVARAHLSRGRR